MPTKITRRTFVGSAAAAMCHSARADQEVVGANDRMRVGWIGCGGRGTLVATAIRNVPGVEIVAHSASTFGEMPLPAGDLATMRAKIVRKDRNQSEAWGAEAALRIADAMTGGGLLEADS